jgi:type II secretory ATPase GspE/PulE/Tfp pilus assembly ATPase PilB-like protein
MECRGTGWKGRTTIAELLAVDDAVRTGILERRDARALAALAAQGGMRDLRRAGLEKALDGLTTVEEVLRVTL